MKTNLGKVAITPKGTWNSTTVYTALDTVNFGGGSWLAKRGNIAVTPTEGDDWMQLSAKGADAELTKDGIVSALGYTPERDYGNYELIETITLTEDTAEIIRTQEPDGTAYNFVKMAFLYSNFILASGSGKISLMLNYGFSDKLDGISLGQDFKSTAVVRGVLMVWFESGIVMGRSTYAMQDGNYGQTYSSFPQKFAWDTLKSLSSGTIKSIKIKQNNDRDIASGSVLTIYAVRA